MPQNSTASSETQTPPFNFFTKAQTIYWELKSDRRSRTGKYCCEGSNQVYNAHGLVRTN